MTDATTELLGSRYALLERVGSGGMGEVWRATDRLTGEQVALKRLMHSAQIRADDTAGRMALAREFSLLASLRHPHIVGVLDFGFESSGRPFFTMRLLQHAATLLDAGRALPQERRIELLFELLQALAYLHRRGIVHRDLKPSNVLVQDERVTLVDFGIAGPGSDDGHSAGTASYIAPEVLRGEAVGPAADLYAVGVIAYELFAGHHPFEEHGLAGLLYRVLSRGADLSKLNVDARLASVIGRLLAKDPRERHGDAASLITAFADAIGRPLPAETQALRDSFLRAAAFVGREGELLQLLGALDMALQGSGSAWLVGGVSGAGKSRLLAELRSHALVRGALVLRGRGVAEGATPYLLFREPLLHLCLLVPPPDDELAVLLAVYPEIERITGRSVEPAAPLDPAGTAERLELVIVNAFRRCTQPLLLELDDCNPSQQELRILARLAQVARLTPVLMVIAYRTDERGSLPAELPDAVSLELDRLQGDRLADLAASILGDEIGRNAAIVQFLERETEGNIFLAIEVVRWLAEEAGRLDRIAPDALPDRVLSGGVQSLARRRLDRLPESAGELLRLAAAFGRRVDVAVLQQAAPHADVEDWLTLCGEASVLEGEGYHWQFAHEKIRQAVLLDVSAGDRCTLHRRIAQSIEQVHGDGDAWVPALAHHWKEAAAPEAVGYLMRAAVQMLTAGLPAQACDAAVDAVRMLGVEIPAQPQHVGLAIGREMGEIHRLLAGRQPPELVALPELTDERVAGAIRILSLIQPAAFISNQLELFALAVLKSMSLTLAHGHGPQAAEVYASYASVARVMTGDSRLAHAFCELARELDNRRLGHISAPVAFLHNWFIRHWIEPVQSSVPLALDGADVGFASGDILYGCFNAAAHVIYLAASGAPLEQVIDAAETQGTRIDGRVRVAAFHCLLEKQFARALAGLTASLTDLSDAECSEERDLASILSSSNVNQIAYYHTAKLRVHYYAGEYRAALRCAESAVALLPAFQGQTIEWEHRFFHALTLAALAADARAEEHDRMVRSASSLADELEASAALCPENFAHKATLVRAEIARAERKDAEQLYGESIAAAARAGFGQHVALGNELYARWLDERGDRQRAVTARDEARTAYRAWGAQTRLAMLPRGSSE